MDQSPSAPGNPEASSPRRRVLIVEDSEFVHQIYRVAFRRLGGWELVHTNNGQEGLDALADGAVDLIIADINMPVMDGLEFLERLRLIEAFQSTHVVVASTEVASERVRDALHRGAQSLLKKPFTLEQILELVTRVIPTLPTART